MAPADVITREIVHLTPQQLRDVIVQATQLLVEHAGASTPLVLPVPTPQLPENKTIAAIKAEILRQPDSELSLKSALEATSGIWADSTLSGEEYVEAIRGNRGERFQSWQD